MLLQNLKKDPRSFADSERAKNSSRFFKTGKGEYGEGDKFLGITVPIRRKIAKKYFKAISLNDLNHLNKSAFHEERLTELLIAVLQFQKGDNKVKKDIFDFYISHTKFIRCF